MNNNKEVPSTDFIDKTAQFLTRAMEKSQWQLRCEDVELEVTEVANKDGLLPLIMWVAGKSLEKVWGPQELVFRCDSNALCGVVPELTRPVLPAAVWLHAIHYQVEEAATHSDVSSVVNGWFAQWNEALAQKSILLLPPKPPTLTQSSTSGKS